MKSQNPKIEVVNTKTEKKVEKLIITEKVAEITVNTKTDEIEIKQSNTSSYGVQEEDLKMPTEPNNSNMVEIEMEVDEEEPAEEENKEVNKAKLGISAPLKNTEKLEPVLEEFATEDIEMVITDSKEIKEIDEEGSLKVIEDQGGTIEWEESIPIELVKDIDNAEVLDALGPDIEKEEVD